MHLNQNKGRSSTLGPSALIFGPSAHLQPSGLQPSYLGLLPRPRSNMLGFTLNWQVGPVYWNSCIRNVGYETDMCLLPLIYVLTLLFSCWHLNADLMCICEFTWTEWTLWTLLKQTKYVSTFSLHPWACSPHHSLNVGFSLNWWVGLHQLTETAA